MDHSLLLLAGPRTDLAVGLDGMLGAMLKMGLPVLAYLACAPVLWLLFRKTWLALDDEATQYREYLRIEQKQDFRPAVMFAIVALILTAQEYYGGSQFYSAYIRPWLYDVQLMQMSDPGGWGQHVDLNFWGEMYSYGWWAFTRVIGYSAIPLLVWKIFFRKDSTIDTGALRIKGMLKHARIYIALVAIVVPCVFIVSRSPDFASYYPFYKQCSRSWLDLLIWEMMYLAQFFALEVFFRGFMLVPLRKIMGTSAIFAMCVPYVMIHFGKPYLEASAAFIAGVALGSLAMKTRSIYSGVIVLMTVALMMDFMALWRGAGLPTQFWPR
jgi:membrane protease YdiL (CAAX protease family)